MTRMSISPLLLGRAQTMLSTDVLKALETAPDAQLPQATWTQLSRQQRNLIREIRQNLKDGFDRSPPSAPAPSEGTPLVGRDPLTQAASAQVNPVTKLDPAALNELFGKEVDTTGLDNFEGQALLDELRTRFFSRHVTLDYHTARERMFTVIDNHGGDVKDVYAGRVLHNAHGIPRADGPDGFNTEHTWPQSQLKAAGKSAAVSDLHHLYPVDSLANNKRGHVPFGWVVKVEWENPNTGAKLGYDAKGQMVFQAPPNHQGDIARSMYWVATAYGLHIPDDEEAVLREWSRGDPVSDTERNRNVAIQKEQGDLNPFVLMPELADKVRDF